MKKWSIVIVAVLLLSLAAGCGADPGNKPDDGTYSAASAATDGGYVVADVRIENGNIAVVELREYTGKGVLKGEGYGHEAWHLAMEELPVRFVKANSAEVDTVSGATGTTGKARDAVDRALQKAKGFDGTFDGLHMGVSDVDGRGNYGIAFVTLVNGKITAVELKEVDGAGEFKGGENYPHQPFNDAVVEMPKRFVAASSSQVNVFTGATGSSTKWIQAVERALDNAK